MRRRCAKAALLHTLALFWDLGGWGCTFAVIQIPSKWQSLSCFGVAEVADFDIREMCCFPRRSRRACVRLRACVRGWVGGWVAGCVCVCVSFIRPGCERFQAPRKLHAALMEVWGGFEVRNLGGASLELYLATLPQRRNVDCFGALSDSSAQMLSNRASNGSYPRQCLGQETPLVDIRRRSRGREAGLGTSARQEALGSGRNDAPADYLFSFVILQAGLKCFFSSPGLGVVVNPEASGVLSTFSRCAGAPAAQRARGPHFQHGLAGLTRIMPSGE